MAQPSPEAQEYIRSLTDVQHRRAAYDYAAMDSSEFQARFGPAVDDLERLIETKFAEVLQAIRNEPPPSAGPITAAAMWVEATQPRRVASALVTIGLIVAAVLERLQ